MQRRPARRWRVRSRCHTVGNRGGHDFRSKSAAPRHVRWFEGCSAEFGEAIYGRNRDELYVHQFASSELETELASGRIVKLRQTTSYPWDGKIRLEILSASLPTTSRTEANEWTLNIRIPGWAKQARLDVNGSQVEQTLTTGRYASLRRPWIKGDVVELSLPMPIRVLEAHPLVEEARNQVAVQRGPLVYCLESSDLPAGTKLLDVALPIDGKLTPRFDAEMLGGVVVLEGRAILRSFRNPDDPASKSLYRDALTEPGHPFDVRLVPYFAWGNRGPSEMSVWLPAERSSEDAGRR